jgi:hypothetical protein
VLAGETAEAKKAYQQFFAFWGDADRDLPALRDAKSEFVKLE